MSGVVCCRSSSSAFGLAQIERPWTVLRSTSRLSPTPESSCLIWRWSSNSALHCRSSALFCSSSPSFLPPRALTIAISSGIPKKSFRRQLSALGKRKLLAMADLQQANSEMMDEDLQARLAAAAPRFQVADRLAEFGETIFTQMSELALKHDAINLGQGFPNFDGPDFVKEAAVDAIRSGKGQYARLQGVLPLNSAIGDRFEKDYNLKVDPDTDVTVTCGCTGAIAAAFLGLINPGDEVVLIEPYYDSYRACAAMVGAKVRYVTLRPPSFAIDERELRAAFSSKTRAIVVNSPHNPTGRVFSRKEMELIASLCQEHDALVLMDQVYEHIVFPGTSFVAMAALPGMYERTVSMSSMGKTFSLTGWKVGWAVAPPPLTDAVRKAHQFLTFSITTPLQWATVTALRAPDEFFQQLTREYTARREKLVTGLREVGFRVFEPEGSFFVMADHTPFGIADDDVAFCKYLIEHVGVVAIPPSCFYSNPNDGKHLIRFAFCKDDNVLSEAISRMKAKLRVAARSQ